LQDAASVTLLLPRDQHLALGHAVLRLPVPRHGLTAGELLQHLRAFYAQPLPADDASVRSLLRDAHGEAAAAAMWCAGPVPRSALLGPRLALEAVVRATRDPCGCVYEVVLSA
jgi:hypothetical protein